MESQLEENGKRRAVQVCVGGCFTPILYGPELTSPAA
jgi:hypothetical protein